MPNHGYTSQLFLLLFTISMTKLKHGHINISVFLKLKNTCGSSEKIKIRYYEDFFNTAQKMKFSIKDFFSKCDQIRRKLRKTLIENFIFCAV